MEIRPQEVVYKEKIGMLDGSPVYEVALKGGLHMILAVRNKKAETLAVAPHTAVAKHIAKKQHAAIEYTDLAKGDYIGPEHYADILPFYEELTAAYRKRQGL